MVYGYARVSTKGQAKDGNSLEGQETTLRAAGAVEIYMDSFTGTKMDRPELTRLLGILKEGDTLIVTKLDRFARSVSQASGLITELIDRGITVNVLNLGILSNDILARKRLLERLGDRLGAEPEKEPEENNPRERQINLLKIKFKQRKMGTEIAME